jgi:hypothetical protein
MSRSKIAALQNFIRYISIAVLVADLIAQIPPKPLNIVMPKGRGRIIYTFDKTWNVVVFDVYDGTRPVLMLHNKATGVEVSYITFPNNTSGKDSVGCMKAIVEPTLRSLSSSAATIKDIHSGQYTTASGKPLTTRAYTIAKMVDLDIKHRNFFGFFGDSSTCFEVHVSKVDYKPSDEPLLTAELEHFAFDPEYQPTLQDYAGLASIFYQLRKQPQTAAYYYQRALDVLPPTSPQDAPSALTLRRVITDQLAMSYGMSGQLKESRAIIAKAIIEDPNYPLNYYNLACADAEQGKAKDAQLHLQQAFDRKANVIPGEKFPDPTQDDSFLKLKKNKEFWAFIQSLK